MAEIPENQKLERLVQKIDPQSRLLRAWPLSGGISAGMTAVKIERPDGQTRRMIVRRPGGTTLNHNPHAARDEFRLLQVTRSLGLATPEAYAIDESGEIFPTPYLVIEYIEGRPEFAPADLASFVGQMAGQLSRIHSADGLRKDLAFLPRQAGECAEAFGNLAGSLDVSGIRERLEAAQPLKQRNASALLHGDFWPGNLLWRDGKLAAVIDWEDALVGDPLVDLSISRLDLAWIFGEDAMNAFTLEYQNRMKIDYSDLPYWDLCAALRLARMVGADLAEWAGFFIPFGRSDITEQTIRKDFRSFIQKAFEALRNE